MTNNPDAEKFSAYSLKTIGENGARVEEVTLYGVIDDSRYIQADLDDKTVLISSAYEDKYGLKKGDVITLKEPYEDKYYGFKITGTYDYDGEDPCPYSDEIEVTQDPYDNDEDSAESEDEQEETTEDSDEDSEEDNEE